MGTRKQAMKLVIGATLSACCLLVGVATADQTPQQAVEMRQKHLKSLGEAFKTVRDELRNSQPNMTQITEAATKIDQLAGDMGNWFPQGSGPGQGIKTDAKPEIWSDPQGFRNAMSKLQAEAPRLLTLAKAGDAGGVKKQVGALGGACKGCHDKYRVPQD